MEALHHAYVATFHDEAVERVATQEVRVPIPDDDKKSTAVYRERLYHEVTKAKAKGSQIQHSAREGYQGEASQR